MLNRKFIAKAVLGTLTLATLGLTGCGSTPTMVEDPYLDDPGYSDPGYTDPGYGGGTTTPGYTDPYAGGVTPGAGLPGGDMGYGNELSASIIKIKNGTFLGIGKCVATVEVMNPSQRTLSGTLSVTFTNKGKPVKSGAQTKQVTIPAGQSLTYTFEDKKWSTDNATVEITTDGSTGAAY